MNLEETILHLRELIDKHDFVCEECKRDHEKLLEFMEELEQRRCLDADAATASRGRRTMIKEEKKTFKDALHVFGSQNQITVALEEMSELQKEFCKYLRNDSSFSTVNIAEEMADVEIMLEQMKMLFRCDDAVEEQRQYKVQRLRERIDRIDG